MPAKNNSKKRRERRNRPKIQKLPPEQVIPLLSEQWQKEFKERVKKYIC